MRDRAVALVELFESGEDNVLTLDECRWMSLVCMNRFPDLQERIEVVLRLNGYVKEI